MPAPAILSAQMEPPPVKPVIEMNYVTEEYKVYDGDVAFADLMYNASGTYEDIGIVPGRGITGLHSDISQSELGIFPPSIRGTNLMNETLAAAMVSSGGLTAVCEFDVSAPEIYGANDDTSIFYLINGDVWLGNEAKGYVEWSTYIQSGVQGEGYFKNFDDPANTTYAGGSAWEASNDRRYRMSGTWCFDLGAGAGVNRYQSGQSIDGQPQGIDTSFGQTPNNSDKNLLFMDAITASHFFGIGVDTSLDPFGNDDAWWWWAKGGWDIRYLAFYRARPIHVLAGLSKPPHTPIQFGQLYSEVIHKPYTPGEIRVLPVGIKVEPVLPLIGIVAPPIVNVNVVPILPTTIGNP